VIGIYPGQKGIPGSAKEETNGFPKTSLGHKKNYINSNLNE
jgi:hypothetical protein